LGGLQGRRTAVRDAERELSIERTTPKKKETGYSGKTLIKLRDEAKRRGR